MSKPGETRKISLEEVKLHNTAKSVWMVIYNSVYDVTAFLEEVCHEVKFLYLF